MDPRWRFSEQLVTDGGQAMGAGGIAKGSYMGFQRTLNPHEIAHQIMYILVCVFLGS